jgi:uncharacterized iron-regulated protein
MTRRHAVGLLLTALMAACTTVPHDPAPGPQEPAEHDLDGRIWDTRTGVFIDRERLFARASDSDHVLLGEVHVNPHHHAAQEEVLAAMVSRGRRPAVVFEMMSRDQQVAIQQVLTGPNPRADAIAAATDFEARGWDWPFYRPLVEEALSNGLPILAGNAPGAETRLVVEEGLDALEPGARSALGLDTPLPAEARAALLQIMIDSHCGHALGELAERLVDAQRVKDATMGDVMLAAGDGGTVLITGTGHARRDHGVPLYVAARRPQTRLLAVRLVETIPGLEDPAAYADRLEGLPEPFDLLWFTPRTEREDPCEQFRKGLERLRQRGDSGG